MYLRLRIHLLLCLLSCVRESGTIALELYRRHSAKEGGMGVPANFTTRSAVAFGVVAKAEGRVYLNSYIEHLRRCTSTCLW